MKPLLALVLGLATTVAVACSSTTSDVKSTGDVTLTVTGMT